MIYLVLIMWIYCFYVVLKTDYKRGDLKTNPFVLFFEFIIAPMTALYIKSSK